MIMDKGWMVFAGSLQGQKKRYMADKVMLRMTKVKILYQACGMVWMTRRSP